MVASTDLRLRYKITEGDVLISDTAQLINECIAQILETSIGSRLFNRGFGSSLKYLLFEPMTELNARIILTTIQQDVERFEPRANFDYRRSEIVPDYDNNGYQLRIVYTINGKQESGEFNTFLESQVR